jgi:hypothetical protein
LARRRARYRPDGKGIRHILYVTSNKGVNFEPDW